MDQCRSHIDRDCAQAVTQSDHTRDEKAKAAGCDPAAFAI
jgi:hypothetical protein